MSGLLPPPSLFREGPGVGASRLASPFPRIEEAQQALRTHPRPLPEEGGGLKNVARDFEALFIAQMLKAARAARLADDPLAPDDSAFRDAQDRDLAQRLATAAPLGVAKLLK